MLKVALAMPLVDHLPAEAFQSHLEMFGRMYQTIRGEGEGSGIVPCIPVNMQPHDRARNLAIQLAVESQCDLIFWVDDDMIIPTDAFPMLLDSLRKTRAVAVSGYYYKRGWPYTSTWQTRDEGTGMVWGVESDKALHPITYAGLGCALVDLKWVQEHLERPYFYMRKDAIEGTQVWDDIGFYEKIRIAGGLVIGDGRVRCGHLAERQIVCDGTVDRLKQESLELQKIAERTTRLPSTGT